MSFVAHAVLIVVIASATATEVLAASAHVGAYASTSRTDAGSSSLKWSAAVPPLGLRSTKATHTSSTSSDGIKGFCAVPETLATWNAQTQCNGAPQFLSAFCADHAILRTKDGVSSLDCVVDGNPCAQVSSSGQLAPLLAVMIHLQDLHHLLVQVHLFNLVSITPVGIILLGGALVHLASMTCFCGGPLVPHYSLQCYYAWHLHFSSTVHLATITDRKHRRNHQQSWHLIAPSCNLARMLTYISSDCSVHVHSRLNRFHHCLPHSLVCSRIIQIACHPRIPTAALPSMVHRFTLGTRA